jgi:hypothetical protein
VDLWNFEMPRRPGRPRTQFVRGPMPAVPADIAAFLKGTTTRHTTPERARADALVCTIRACGLWMVEISHLAADEIDLEGSTLNVQCNSAMLRPRRIPISRWAVPYLARWFSLRPRQSEWAFPTLDGAQPSVPHLRNLLWVCHAETRLQINASRLRDSAMVDWARFGLPPEEIRRRAGLSNSRYSGRLLEWISTLASRPAEACLIERKQVVRFTVRGRRQPGEAGERTPFRSSEPGAAGRSFNAGGLTW